MKTFDEITWLQKIRMVQDFIDDDAENYTLSMDILLQCDFIQEELDKYPPMIKAVQDCKEGKDPYTWKLDMQQAEMEICAKWVYRIYRSVQRVLDRGDSLV